MSALKRLLKFASKDAGSDRGNAVDAKAGGIKLVSSNDLPLTPKVSSESVNHVRIVQSEDDFPYFSKVLYSELKMPSDLRHLICPVLLDVGTTKNVFALILIESQLNSDLMRGVADDLISKGYKKSETWLYVASDGVLVDLSRDGFKKKKDSLVSSKESSALKALFEKVLRFGLDNDATDLHFEINLLKSTSPVGFCINKKVIYVKEFEIPSNTLLQCISHMYNSYATTVSHTAFNQTIRQECKIPLMVDKSQVELRVATTPHVSGLLCVMRIQLPGQKYSVSTYEELGYLPDQCQALHQEINRPKGGIILCGRPGDGKSTLQHAMLSTVPRYKPIITVEDPVENILPHGTQISVSRSIGDDEYDPYVEIRAIIKRLNPRIVSTGEIRDSKTAGLYKDIVEAGMIGLGTLHCSSVVEALTMRLVSDNLGLGKEVIATPNFVNLIIYQALVNTLCSCKVPATSVYDDEYLSKIERYFNISREKVWAKNKAGCSHCQRDFTDEFNGQGKPIAVAEMLKPTYGILRLVREAKNIEIEQRFHMLRGEEDFESPVTKGKTALEVGMYHVAQGRIDPKDLEFALDSFDEYYENKMRQIDV